MNCRAPGANGKGIGVGYIVMGYQRVRRVLMGVILFPSFEFIFLKGDDA